MCIVSLSYVPNKQHMSFFMHRYIAINYVTWLAKSILLSKPIAILKYHHVISTSLLTCPTPLPSLHSSHIPPPYICLKKSETIGLRSKEFFTRVVIIGKYVTDRKLTWLHVSISYVQLNIQTGISLILLCTYLVHF